MITLQERVHASPKPDNWQLGKLHQVFRVLRGNKNNGMKEDNLLSLSYGRIIQKNIETVGGLLPENFEGYQIVEPGNIVLRLTDLQNDKRSLRQGLVTQRGIITSAYDAVEVQRDNDPRFWFYSLLALDLAKHYYSLGGGVRQSVKFADFPNDWVYHPDLSTQRQIADFLDRETARIDLLIEKKQRLVALLGEKAKSVNELFFLNTTASDIQPLHRLYRVVTGKTPSRSDEDNFSDEEGLPWATPANLGFLAPIENTKERLTDKGCEGQPVVDAGTVLLNGIGASVGKIGIAGTRLSFNQQIHALIAKKKVLADRFLFFQLLTLKEQLVLLANSTTLPILNAERLGRLELRIFDFDEQHRHCANMDALLRHEDQTAQKINASIDRLKEYRSALITAAVTGQVDVTTYAKSGTPDRRLDAIQEEMGA